jgi:molecular chaperone GrpE
MALEASKAHKEGNSLYEGVEMTYRICQKTLQKHGVEELDPLESKFDPNKHEAMFEVDDLEKPPGTVAFVAQKGFTIGDRVLRAPKVGVVRNR